MDRILDEAWADAEVRRVLLGHLSELCATHRGYAIIVSHGINLKGDIKMPAPQLFKADDGSVQEVVESKTLTLDEIDQRIAGAQEHVAHLQSLRDNFVALQSGTDTSVTPAPVDPPLPAEQPVVAADGSAPEQPGGVELTVTPGDGSAPANADQGQAPAAPAVDGPATDTAAVNNGQVNPADGTNPVPEQPIVGV